MKTIAGSAYSFTIFHVNMLNETFGSSHDTHNVTAIGMKDCVTSQEND